MLTSETGTFWKYNLLYHMTAHHLQADGSFPPFPRQLIVRSHITKAEEVALGIGAVQTSNWRDQYEWPQSDTIEAMCADTYYELGNRK